MNIFFKYAKKVSYTITFILCGTLLFVALAASGMNRSWLDSAFHKHLFEKNDIYTEAYTVMKTSIKDFTENIKKHSPQDFQQNKDIFTQLEKSITPDTIKFNLDNIREDTFKYFEGKRMFLPDIYLDNKNMEITKDGQQKTDNKLSAEAFSKIEKINLSAILLYANRSDITDQFTTLKFVYNTMAALPGTALLFLSFLALAGILLQRGILKSSGWLCRIFLLCGILCLLSGAGLIAYSLYVLPSSSKIIAMSVPIKAEVILSYARDCVRYMYLWLLVLGMLCLGAAAFIRRLPKQPVPLIARKLDIKEPAKKYLNIASYSIMGLVLVFILSTAIKDIYAYKKDFDANDYATVIAKLKNDNRVTQVISAKDDTIYTLEIKLVDAKEGTPLQDIPVNVEGTSDLLKKNFNETLSTNVIGAARLTLDKGTFRLSFVPSSFPSGYKIPSPYSFSLKTAGTTTITMNLDKAEEASASKWGIAEVEVLDKDNNPVPGLMLTIPENVSAPGQPDSVSSITNSEGIAAFKVNEGSYSILFSEDGFPGEYRLPSPSIITVKENSVSRYTVKLVEAAKQKASKTVTNTSGKQSSKPKQ